MLRPTPPPPPHFLTSPLVVISRSHLKDYTVQMSKLQPISILFFQVSWRLLYTNPPSHKSFPPVNLAQPSWGCQLYWPHASPFFCLRIHNSRIECLAKTKVITYEGTPVHRLTYRLLSQLKCNVLEEIGEDDSDDESKRILMRTKRETNRPRMKIIFGIFYRPCDMAERPGPEGVEQEPRTFLE